MGQHYFKFAIVGAIAAAITAFLVLDPGRYMNLDYLQSQREAFEAFYAANPALTVMVYFLVYITVTALSLPGATIMTLAAGALFGLFAGVILVSFASTIGATLAFLAARVVLRDTVQNRFGESLRKINEGVERDGAFYLFGLRLVPALPFFVINLVMGLTPMRTFTFFWVSQVGMIAGTIVYVNAGTQLAALESVGGLLSPTLIASFSALGLFPLIARKALQIIQAGRASRGAV